MQIEKYKYVAHRGLHNIENNIIENTLKAFENAMKNQYAIELDVQLTKDEQLIVFHDYDIKRMAGKDILIKDLTLSELNNITLKESTFVVPTLEDVLKLVDGKVALLIEIKNEGNIGKLEEILISKLEKYKGEVALESFNPFVVRYLKNKTNYNCGYLVCKNYPSLKGKILSIFNSIIISTNILKVDFIAYKYNELDSKIYNKIKTNKIHLLLWTIKKDEELNKSLKIADGVIFENINPKIQY